MLGARRTMIAGRTALAAQSLWLRAALWLGAGVVCAVFSVATRFSGVIGTTISRGVWFTGDTTRRSGVSVTITVAVCGGGAYLGHGCCHSFWSFQSVAWLWLGALPPLEPQVMDTTTTAKSTGVQPLLMGRLSLQALLPVETGVGVQELWWFLEPPLSGTTANTPSVLPLPQGPVHQPSDIQMCGSQTSWSAEQEVLCWTMDVLLDATYRGETKGMTSASTVMLMSLPSKLLTETIWQIF